MKKPEDGATVQGIKPWYKKWWGIILAIIIWPFFLIWFVWVKTKWHVALKVVAIILLAFFGSVYFAAFASKQTPSTSHQATAKASPKPASSLSPKPTPKATPKPTTTPKPTATPKPAPARKVTGTATTLGAGTFTGGTDVAVGLYNVTTTDGQSGNFIVTGTDEYDEILGVSDGQGVPEVRAQISKGDSIQISGLSQVIFTPVTTPLITTHSTVNLYAGTFIVGQDIGAGRYVATTTAGSSGNFIVTGADEVDEILGQSDGQGVPSVTTNLTKGDIISISGLGQVTMTATN